MESQRSVYADTDLLIWVGGRYETVESYVTEAQRQGCSRRLPPDVFSWIIPDQTRVFLAHKGDQQDDAQGVLFGYYLVSALHIYYNDVVLDESDFLPDEPGSPPKEPIAYLLGARRPNTEKEVRQRFDQWVARNRIVVRKRRRYMPPPEQDPLEALIDELWQAMIENALKERGVKHKRYIPASCVADIPFRLCGSPDVGGYAVDWLADELLDCVLDSIVENESPNQGYYEEYYETIVVPGKPVRRRPRKKTKAEPGASPSNRFAFETFSERLKKRKSGLVLFEQPYPLYYHPLTAAFRGIRRLSGDALLCSINRG